MNLDIGLYNVDLNKIINFLKQDLDDDWFPDPLMFEDRFKEKTIVDYFEKNIKENYGIYQSQPRILLNVPKPQGTLRYSLETNFFDRLAYHAYGITLVQYFDKYLSRRVFNHRFNQKDFNGKRSRYLFYNPILQWKKYEEFVKIDAKTSTILLTDLQNYFEHINISILKKMLYNLLFLSQSSGSEKAKIRFCIDAICGCLSKWSFNSEHGLPQNRDISSFLASIYLINIDKLMIDNGYNYYRYMDDIRVICTDKFEARKILKILSEELRKIDLSLNGLKTKILEYGSHEHQSFLSDDDIDLERIDALINTKKRNIVAITYADVKENLEKSLEQEEFNSKKFRALINRMTKIARCGDIKKPINYYDKIKVSILKAVVNHPFSMDKYYEFLASIELTNNDLLTLYSYLSDENLSVYSWQSYAIWKLFILNNYNTEDLLVLAKKQLTLQKDALV